MMIQTLRRGDAVTGVWCGRLAFAGVVMNVYRDHVSVELAEPIMVCGFPMRVLYDVRSADITSAN
jgi:hypothetical protein